MKIYSKRNAKVQFEILLTILLLTASTCYSFEIRRPDYIRMNGDLFMISNNPMELFFEKHPEFTPKPATYLINDSKHYNAVYEIVNGQLFLVEVRYVRRNEDNTHEYGNWIADIFEGKNEVLLDWFTGILLIEKSTVNFENSVAKCRIMEIEKGGVKRLESISDHYLKKLERHLFRKYSKTTDYAVLKQKHPKLTDKEMFKFVIQSKIWDLMTVVEQLDDNS
jgi:hypothetical protein